MELKALIDGYHTYSDMRPLPRYLALDPEYPGLIQVILSLRIGNHLEE